MISGKSTKARQATAPAQSERAANPFLPMPPRVLAGIRIAAGLYALAVCSAALFNATEHGVSMAFVALSNAWLLFWIFWPFIFYKPGYGWCHPLVLLSLLGFARMIPKSTPLLMNGLSEHLMLPDWSSAELNLLFAYGNLVNSLALIAVYLGFYVGPRLAVPRFRTAAPGSRLYAVLLLALGASIVAFIFCSQVYGGFTGHLKSLAFGMSKRIDLANDVEGLGHYALLMNMATVAAVVWVCAQANALRNPLFWLVAVSSLALAYLSDGKRSNVIYPAILIMLCWMLRNGRVPYLRLAAVGVCAFFLLGLLGLFRTANWSDTENLNLTFLGETSLADLKVKSMEELARRAGSESTYYPILAKVPGREDLLYGKTYLEWGLRFIPRELWPDKPRGVDVQANETFYGDKWGLPAGAVGEAYWNFHLPGVIVVFFLFGMFRRWMADVLEAYPHAPAVMALYMISLFYLDPSQNGFRTWLYAVGPALLMVWFGGLLALKGSRRRSVPGVSPAHSHAD